RARVRGQHRGRARGLSGGAARAPRRLARRQRRLRLPRLERCLARPGVPRLEHRGVSARHRRADPGHPGRGRRVRHHRPGARHRAAGRQRRRDAPARELPPLAPARPRQRRTRGDRAIRTPGERGAVGTVPLRLTRRRRRPGTSFEMVSSPRTILLVTTVLSFCTLYAPQPILPSLARAFDVDPAGAALLVSITLAPLALAPIAYGYVLGAVPARRMLMAALVIMAASQLAFALAPDYRVALAARAALGLALPAAFTALMTATAAAAPPERVRQAMGTYIAAT